MAALALGAALAFPTSVRADGVVSTLGASHAGTLAVVPPPAAALKESAGKRSPLLETEFPPEYLAGPTPIEVPVAGDRSALVYMAPDGVDEAIVYLHGHCGSLEKIDAWAPEVTRFGTVIALLGNWECDGAPGRFRWGLSVKYLDARIREAANAVKALRGGHLDAEHLTVIGYSQGAEKAELLPRWFPERYPRVVLAGPPAAPQAWLLAPAKAVVVIAGENERQDHILRGFRELQFAGELAAFMELPAAAHGQFGPEGARVIRTALWWLFDRAP